jgi:hypothetical protein
MVSIYVSLAFYVVAAAFFISWFVVASRLGRDKSTDRRRRSRMNMLVSLGFAALLAGAAVAYLR